MTLVLSFSSISADIVGDIYHASFSLRYLTKYTLLDSKKYYVTSVLAYIVFSLLFVALLGLTTVIMYSHKFETLLTPKSSLGLCASALLSILFIHSFSMLEAITALVLRKPKAVGFLSFLTLILSYPLLFFQLYIGGRTLVLSPFNATNSLLYHYYSGLQIPEGALVSPMASQPINPNECWLSLILWIIGISTLNIFLLKKQKGISIEELRL